MNNVEWFSLSDIDRKLGRARGYTSLWIRRHEAEFPKEMIIEAGKSKVISEEGFEYIKKQKKDRGRPRKNSN